MTTIFIGYIAKQASLEHVPIILNRLTAWKGPIRIASGAAFENIQIEVLKLPRCRYHS